MAKKDDKDSKKIRYRPSCSRNDLGREWNPFPLFKKKGEKKGFHSQN
jgi:hypothetical protein